MTPVRIVASLSTASVDHGFVDRSPSARRRRTCSGFQSLSAITMARDCRADPRSAMALMFARICRWFVPTLLRYRLKRDANAGAGPLDQSFVTTQAASTFDQTKIANENDTPVTHSRDTYIGEIPFHERKHRNVLHCTAAIMHCRRIRSILDSPAANLPRHDWIALPGSC